MRPLERLVKVRTGSNCSRVGPAVTNTRFPDSRPSRARKLRSATATIASGSLMRPGRSLSPSASGPISGPIMLQPRCVRVWRLDWVDSCEYIWSFIAGASKTGAVPASRSAVRTSSAIPCAARAMRFAVAGATMMRSASLPSCTCASAASRSHREVRTGRRVNASKVTGPTNSRPAAVRTTSTAASISVSRRATVQAL